MNDWDERYRRGEHSTSKPSHLLVRVIKNLRPGRALDVACGTGRHAVYLASHGWDVIAVDSSPVGIQLLKERARQSGVALDARVADLERDEFQIEKDAYDLVCVFYYLQRDLFKKLQEGVRKRGTFIAAIHMVDASPQAKPMNPDFLLNPDELREYFYGWDLERYHETVMQDDDPGEHTRRTAEIIAHKM